MNKTALHTALKKERNYFKTNPQFFQPNLNVDAANGVIKDVSVCSVGEASGHNIFLDISFITDVVKLGNEFKQGVKSRFGHPNLSNEALGTYLGRLKNFRVKEDKAIADLYLDEVAKKSPGGDLYTWVINMAAKNPDQFGASCVFEPGEPYQVIEGRKVYGEAMKPDLPLYASILALNNVDLVDEPAANANGLFSQQFNADKFAVRVTTFLDENPDVWTFVEAHPEKFEPFFKKYSDYKKKNTVMGLKKSKSFFQKLAAAFTDNEEPEIENTFAQIDAVTDDGKNIRVDAATDAPAVGDPVYIVDSSTDSEEVAPDGDYTIAGGDYDGYKLTVVNGVISAVFNPNEPAIEVQQSAIPSYKALQQENAKLQNQINELTEKITALNKEFTAYKNTPLEKHTTVIPDDDGNGKSTDTDEQFFTKPWNKKAKKTA